MEFYLNRFSYAREDTEGEMILPDQSFNTMECPWTPGANSGGKPFKSCIPDGEYEVIRWKRPRGDEAFLIRNPDLGVWGSKEEWEQNGGRGRYLVLIHVANFVSDVVGCVAVGMERACLRNNRTGAIERAAANSGAAMRLLLDVLGSEEEHRLIIKPKYGAGD